jgi:hypothetical protein
MAVLPWTSWVVSHAGSGRSDLPLDAGLAVWGAAVAVAVSFASVGIFWQRARLLSASNGRTAPSVIDTLSGPVTVLARVVGLVAFGLAIGSAFWGLDNPVDSFIHPLVFGVIWVIMQAVSVVAGDVWRAINPLDTISTGLRRLLGRREAGSSTVHSHWLAVVGVLGFLWLELAYHGNDTVPLIGWALVSYSAVMIAGGVAFGRDWLRASDFLSVLFELLAAMSPLYRDAEGRLRWRLPLTGLAAVQVRPGTLAFLLAVLGGTTYDGVSGSPWWNNDVVPSLASTASGAPPIGWGSTAVATIGLVWCIASVSVVYLLACFDLDRAERYAPSLVPIVIGYAVAHYFSYAIERWQHLLFGLSDPFDLGWDILGNELVSSASVPDADIIAWVQVGAIVIGHIGAVIVAHDMAVEDEPNGRSIVSELPLAALMVAYTGLGLWLLMNT